LTINTLGAGVRYTHTLSCSNPPKMWEVF